MRRATVDSALRAALFLVLAAGCGDGGEGGDDPAVAGGSERQSDAVFVESELNDFHLTMSAADWQSIIWDTMGDTYRHGTLQWKNVTITDIGVRPSGHATRWAGNPKQPLKLKFNEFVQGQKFMGLKTLKLDGLIEDTMMRERIAYGVYRALIPTAPRTAHCKLFVNGEYRGLYMAEERVSDDLLDHRYGNQDGNLYRLMVEIPEAFADRGTDPAAYMPRPFQPETNEVNGDHTPLPRFIQTLNYRPAELGTVCDPENLTTFLALEVALMSRDGLLRDDGPPQNHYVYFHPGSGRVEFIPWDLDQTLTLNRASLSMYHNFEKTRIASVVRATPELDAQFRQKLGQIITTLTHPDVLFPRIDAVYQHIRDAAHADTYKGRTNEDFDSYPDYLKAVIRSRYDSLRAQLGLP